MARILGMMMISLVFFSHPVSAEGVDYANLEVRVEGIKNNKGGEIGVALFNSPKGYPTHLENAYNPKWVRLQGGDKQALDFLFEGVPFGDYAVSVIHDENGNRNLDVDSYGFPQEGVGFSNNQKIVMSAPAFSASKFSVSEAGNMKLTIQLDYRQ